MLDTANDTDPGRVGAPGSDCCWAVLPPACSPLGSPSWSKAPSAPATDPGGTPSANSAWAPSAGSTPSPSWSPGGPCWPCPPGPPLPPPPGVGPPPPTPAQQSLPGLVHGLAITVAFGCLSAACFVMARRFADDPAWRGWGRYSTGTGVVVAAGYVATAVVTGLDQAGGLPNAPGGLLQRGMIIVEFAWLILLAARLLRRQPAA